MPEAMDRESAICGQSYARVSTILHHLLTPSHMEYKFFLCRNLLFLEPEARIQH